MKDAWWWVLLASATAYAMKLVGYLLPQRLLDRQDVHAAAGALTVGLLTSLVISNAISTGQLITPDARLLALAAAAVALRLKAPYIVVVIAGALATALGRMAGLP